MKRKIELLFLLLAISMGAASQDIKLSIVDGLTSRQTAEKQRMEKAVSALLSEINRACAQERSLNLAGIDMDASGKVSLQRLWENLHFYCEEPVIGARCITTSEGYAIRNIYIGVEPMIDEYTDERERSLTIRLTKAGQIANAVIATSDEAYERIVKTGLDVLDLQRRETILAFVENYRSHYDEKDLDAIRQVFSEDALIITGTVVQRKVSEGDRVRLKEEIVYHEHTKSSYLNSLAGIFKRNKYIKVTFSDIEVFRHPSNPDYYAVTLKQNWHAGNSLSNGYNDEGYLVLIWEFREGMDPIIHVRTWQPDRVGGKMLSRDDVFDIMDFTIPKKK